MTQKEILDLEQENTDSIFLYLEGSFYKAYERSAFAFSTRVKEFRLLRKESKTLGRDILYLGFPQTSLEKVLSNCMVQRIDEKRMRVVLSYPIDLTDFEAWRDAQEVKIASQALVSPYTKVIENSPLFKVSYDILTQSIAISRNISKPMQAPFGIRLKSLAYESCLKVRSVYDVKGEDRARLIESIFPINDEFSFLIQVLKDAKEISLKSFALLSEQIISVSSQLSLLHKKVTG